MSDYLIHKKKSNFKNVDSWIPFDLLLSKLKDSWFYSSSSAVITFDDFYHSPDGSRIAAITNLIESSHLLVYSNSPLEVNVASLPVKGLRSSTISKDYLNSLLALSNLFQSKFLDSSYFENSVFPDKMFLRDDKFYLSKKLIKTDGFTFMLPENIYHKLILDYYINGVRNGFN